MESSRLITNDKIIITRKVRVFIDVQDTDKDIVNKYYRRLFTWQDIAFKSSNLIASHLFIQEQVKEILYFQDDIKIKLIDRQLDENGILNTSSANSMYRMIRHKYKDELPSAIASSLSHKIYLTFYEEKSNYVKGDRSLRSYKRNIPVPITSQSIHNLEFDDKIKNFRFSVFQSEKLKIPFRTFLGQDRSNNQEILQRCKSGEYSIRDSAYVIKNGKIFFLFAVEIPKKEHFLSAERKAVVTLSFLAPLILNYNGKVYQIGDKESYIYKRLAIQQGLRRRQQMMKFNSGGKGRKQKTLGLEQFKTKEKNFVQTFTHKLSSELVSFCVHNNIGKIELKEISQFTEEAKIFPFVLRNWSFGGLIDKIGYKCKMKGIIIED